MTPASGIAAPAPEKLDKGLFTEYTVQNNLVRWTICGRLPEASGCFGGGDLFPFEQACAVLQGAPKVKGTVIKRAIYVLDRRTAASAPVKLYIYTRTETIHDQDDAVEMTLAKVVDLEIAGGKQSRCSMAADKKFVYLGTNADNKAALVSKIDYSASYLTPGFSNVLESISTDGRGYVAVSFGGLFYILYGGATIMNGGGDERTVETDTPLMIP